MYLGFRNHIIKCFSSFCFSTYLLFSYCQYKNYDKLFLGWPATQTSTFLFLPSSGTKGMCHHYRATNSVFKMSKIVLYTFLEENIFIITFPGLKKMYQQNLLFGASLSRFTCLWKRKQKWFKGQRVKRDSLRYFHSVNSALLLSWTYNNW